MNINLQDIEILSWEPGSEICTEVFKDIWPRLEHVMHSQIILNNDTEALTKLQLQCVESGLLEMQCPFLEGVDACVNSFYRNFRFVYEFSGLETYFWISGLLADSFAPCVIFFPKRRCAIHIYGNSVDVSFLEGIKLADTTASAAIDRLVPAVVVGFPHMLHMLWNELPSLLKLISLQQSTRFTVIVMFEPFGPMGIIYPELASRIEYLNAADVFLLDQKRGLLVGVGSRHIPCVVQERLYSTSKSTYSVDLAKKIEEFEGSHEIIIWISVKPPNRTAFNQVEMIIHLVKQIKTKWPSAGFIFDGVSIPEDYDSNVNYEDWFRQMLEEAYVASGSICENIMSALPEFQAKDFQILNGISVGQEIVWGKCASVYFAHGGSMQHKIGWVHDIPGLIHSNSEFLRSYQNMERPVANSSAEWYLPAGLIQDDRKENYNDTALARKDLNYSFVNVSVVAEFFIEKISNEIMRS